MSYTDKRNRLYTDSSACDNVSLKEIEEGTYLAPTSIITKKIALAIVITEGDTLDSGVWAVKTSTLYNRQATYGGYTA